MEGRGGVDARPYADADADAAADSRIDLGPSSAHPEYGAMAGGNFAPIVRCGVRRQRL